MMDDCCVYSNGICKSLSDKKEYRLLTLDNGLRVVLVSDVENIVNIYESPIDGTNSEDENEESDSEDTDEKLAACALCVRVGSFSDPPEIQGLAHFLEHMVFMGSEKYPQESALDEFLHKRGGSDNGATDSEYTTFHIECPEEFLNEGMDIFSQFFISPLMLREAMTREREAIDAEFDLALPSDGTRAEQLLGSLAPPGHPAALFPWGNLVTLRDRVSDDDLHKAAHDFRDRYYSAQHMTIAVVARLPLDTLEDYVRTSFSAVPNNGLPAPEFSHFRGLFGGDQFHSTIWMMPVHDLCEVSLSWILPPMEEYYESAPLRYLSCIIGNEGKGSLISFLRKKLWCLNCTTGNDYSGFEYNSIFSVFSISLECTEQGMTDLDQVLLTVFEYLAMLRENLPDKRYFDELKDISDAKFKYKFEDDAASYAESLCASLHWKRPEHIALDTEVFFIYKPDLIKMILNTLRHDNVNVLIDDSKKPIEFYDSEEPWFKSKYRKENIAQDWIKSWKSAAPKDEFHLPLPNPYITRRFSILESNAVTHPPYPEKVLQNTLIEVWYRQDILFQRPFAIFNIYLQSPIAKANARNALLLKILEAFLQQKLKEEFYQAFEAGYTWTCTVGDFGLVFKFSGFDEKLPLFHERVLISTKAICDSLLKPENQGLFQAIKVDLSRDIYNAFVTSSDLNKVIRFSLLLESYWTPMEMWAELEEVTLEHLNTFCHQFFEAVYVKMLLQGNISSDVARDVGQMLPAIFNLSPLVTKPAMSVWKLPHNTEICCRIPSFNSVDNNSVITNYYQTGPTGHQLRTSCTIELIMMIMNPALFDALRTNQQIGYDVSAEIRDTFGILGFTTTIHYQTSKFTADEVNERIEGCLCKFAKYLENIPEEELETTKDGLCALKRHVDLSLYDEVTRNFTEITSGEYRFDRLQQEAEIIQTLTREEISSWFASNIQPSPTSKKLSVQVHGSIEVNNVTNPKERYAVKPLCPDSNKFIKNLSEFKMKREFYPPQQAS